MKVINLGGTNSVLNNFIAQLRDRTVQKERMRFRANMERIGEIFGYELSKTLSYSPKEVETPLGTAEVPTCDSVLVLATILRAGLPLQNGLLKVFDDSDCAFIAAWRKYDREDDYHINVQYSNCPSLEGKVLIVSDAMLATGASMEISYNKLIELGGTPLHTHIVCPVSSVYAVEELSKKFGDDVTLWTAAIDEELTSQSYIIPGIGDPGDLAFGDKI